MVQDLAYTHDCVGNLTHREDRAIPAVYFDNAMVTALTASATTRSTASPVPRAASTPASTPAASAPWTTGTMRRSLQHPPGDAMAWRNYAESYRHDPVGNLLRLAHAAGHASFTRTYAYESGDQSPELDGGRRRNLCARPSPGARIHPLDAAPVGDGLQPPRRTDRDRPAGGGRGLPETTWYVYDHDGRRIRKVTDLALNGPASRSARRSGSISAASRSTAATPGSTPASSGAPCR